jgi:hypothetical protein
MPMSPCIKVTLQIYWGKLPNWLTYWLSAARVCLSISKGRVNLFPGSSLAIQMSLNYFVLLVLI